MLGVALITTGELAGRPALTVQAGQLDLSDPNCLVHRVLQRRQPGVTLVQLVGAPWGDPGLDDAIHQLSSDPRTAGYQVWAERPCQPTGWSTGPVWWCLDLSTLLARQTTVASLVNSLNSLPPLPQPAELVVRAPHAHLAAAHLDELTTRLDCEIGWLYADKASPAWDPCEVAVTQACGLWGLRELQAVQGHQRELGAAAG